MATQIAERFEASRKGRDFTNFSLQALQQHLSLGGEAEEEAAAAADEMLTQTHEELDYQYDENGYDGQFNAVDRN